MSKVTILDVGKRFGDVVTIEGLSITAEEGQLTTLLGPSGCGKTTTLRMVAGLESPDNGEIWIGDKLVAAPAQRIYVAPEKRNIGMVFQSYAIWPHMSAFENVAFPLRLRGLAKSEINRRVQEVFSLLRLDGLEGRYPGQLSGGQQQRVALGRAIVYQSSLLLLDEPLANLDAKVRDAVRFELRELQRRLGFTTIYVTHDQAEAMVLSDKIVVMDRGQIAQVGAPAEIYNRPATHFVADFIGQSNFVMGTVTKRCGVEGEIELDDGVTARVELPEAFDVGRSVFMCIRPEDFELSAKAPNAAASGVVLPSRVLAKAFLGNILLYKVVWSDRELQVQSAPFNDPMVGEADEVWLSASRDRIKVLG